MRHYELLFVLRPTLTEEEASTKVNFIKEVLEKNGAEIATKLNMGPKKLAYPIQKFERGLYTVFYFKAPAKLIAELERIIRINEEIIKFMTVKFETKTEIANWEKAVAKNNKKETVTKTPKEEVIKEAPKEAVAVKTIKKEVVAETPKKVTIDETPKKVAAVKSPKKEIVAENSKKEIKEAVAKTPKEKIVTESQKKVVVAKKTRVKAKEDL